MVSSNWRGGVETNIDMLGRVRAMKALYNPATTSYEYAECFKLHQLGLVAWVMGRGEAGFRISLKGIELLKRSAA